jgi:predicted small lipoprotein YifL
MLNRRNLMVSFVALLLVASLAGCVAAPVAVPARAVTVDVDTALAAQGKLGNLMMGSVEWSESEFSSLVSVLLEQNSGENNPVTGVHVWFEPNNEIVARVALKDGVLPTGNSLDLAGTISVQNNHVVVNITEAGAGNLSISGALLGPINQQINAALADPSMGVAVNVATDTGKIMVGLGGM